MYHIRRVIKYWKVITDNSVHCFVDRITGDVFKAASWNKPAPIPRFNLLINAQECLSKCDWNEDTYTLDDKQLSTITRQFFHN